jgi:hypothetical protein
MTTEYKPAPAVPDYPDLHSNGLRFFFRAFASVLRERPLRSFEECNELVGEANGVASGAVELAIDDLGELGYLRQDAATGGVELTKQGSAAARAAGILST